VKNEEKTGQKEYKREKTKENGRNMKGKRTEMKTKGKGRGLRR
jgi:hypothetical protein